MRAGQAKMSKSGSVRAQLVSRQQFRHDAVFPEQLAHQPECGALVTAALNQHVENLALVIDGAPQILWGGRRKQAASLSGYHTDGAPPW